MLMDIVTLRLYAFRYCLGRASYAVQEMVEELIINWGSMEAFQSQIQNDIELAIVRGSAGHDIDIEQWQRILKL